MVDYKGVGYFFGKICAHFLRISRFCRIIAPDMKKAKYSVIIPTLNEEVYLPKLLASLSVQTERNFEVIVVDGSSKDKTVAVANSFKRKVPGLKVIVSKKASLPLQRNLGAQKSSGEWLAFIDADSILMPNFFERLQVFINRTNPAVLTTWFSPDSDVTGDAVTALLGNLMLESAVLIKRPLSPGPLTVVLRGAYDSVGGYDEEHAFHEDMDFGLRLFKQGIRVAIIKETLFIMSFRRMRKQGTLRVIQQYIKSAFPVLLLNKTFKTMPGYIMGGQEYALKRGKQKPNVRAFEKKLRKFMKELFA
jgi:glycosyltransferase involved in cell wall biosynthesis